MLTPTSIIVYRNPAEAALWESGMVFPIMASVFVGFLFALIALFTLGYVAERFRWRNYRADVVAIVALLVGFCYSLHRFGVI